MILQWMGIGKSATAEQLMARRQYRQAAEVLKEEIKTQPSDSRWLMLADAYTQSGNKEQAVKVLMYLADRLAASGSAGKAIAILKRVQRLDPAQSGVYESLAALIRKEERAASAMAVDFDGSVIGLDLPPIEEAPAPAEEAAEGDRSAGLAGASAFTGSPEEMRVLDDAVASPLFDSFSREELLAVMGGLRLITADPGDVVVAQGDPGDSVFLVATGIVKAFVRDGARGHRQVRMLHDGDFFGEISLLRGEPRSATITAATQCDLLELDRATLEDIASTHPRVMDVLRQFCEERLASDRAGGTEY